MITQRLSIKTNLKLAKLWLDRKEYPRLNKIVKELHAACAPSDDGADVDSSKGTTQLEVFALEIQMYGETKNNKKLRVSLVIVVVWGITDVSLRTGNLREESASAIGDSSSSNSGGHSRVRREDVHVRECVLRSSSALPANDCISQRIGRKRKSISSSRSSRTTKPDRLNEFKFSSTSSSLICSWVAISTRSIRKKPSRSSSSRVCDFRR